MSNQKKSTPTISNLEEIMALPSMAARIRALSAGGMSRGDISRVLSIKYQWVRNVLITPTKK